MRFEELVQARFVRITHGRFAVWFDPFGMLNPQVVVTLLPELRISLDLMMHDRRPSERFMCGQ